MFEISKYEFGQWLLFEGIDSFTPYEKEVIRIITKHFDCIAQQGTWLGKRAKYIGSQISELGNRLSEEDLSFNYPEYVQHSVRRLSTLSVENFRGFGPQENFTFSKRFTLYHGPNGSGKTSLCEALEYCSLGSIAEASTRNIPVEKYILHNGQKSHTSAQLKCEFQDGDTGDFPTDLAAYRFAFIERNRILDFSHIGAATVKNQTNRIAALFGLSEFEHFVHEFTEVLDERYLMLQSDNIAAYQQKRKELTEKVDRLEQTKTVVRDKKKMYEQLVAALGVPGVSTMEEVEEYFYNNQTGALTIANRAAAANKIDILDPMELESLKAAIASYLEDIAVIKENNSKILMDLHSANLAELFHAVEKLGNTYTESVCPVCRTPLSQSTEDPFRYCRAELQKLGEVEHAKQQVRRAALVAITDFGKIKENLSKPCMRLLLKDIPLLSILVEKQFQRDELEAQTAAVEEATATVLLIEDVLKDSEKLKSQIAEYNEQAKLNNSRYSQPVIELTQKHTELVRAENQWRVAEKAEQQLAGEVDADQKALGGLESAANRDNESIIFNKNMADGYQSVVRKLGSYVTTLPGKLSRAISEKVCEYYNFVNAGDADFELIEKVDLPVAANERIMLEMRDGTYQDALLFLSEGHVRILGLSILLAKAHVENLPFLVFDDIVNSIDDDHREGVAKLLVTHPDFNDIQMILTCHGEMFVSTLESYINSNKDCDRYMFLPADTLSERGVVIRYRDSTVPLKIARQKFENNELKDVGAKCRQAVEGITSKLWSKVVNSTGGISVSLRQLDGRPDLRQIADGLTYATKGNKIAGAENIHQLLERLTSRRMWNLLNKGTHVDPTTPEFDRVSVKELLELVDELNNEVNALKIIASVKKNQE